MKTILVVEDDDTIRELYAELLGEAGYAVVQAENGCVGLRKLEELGGLAGLVFLDLMMPEMGGIEMLAVLRHADRLAELPVVLITASAATRQECAGARRLVQKPAPIDVLLELAEEFCGRAA